VAIGLGYGFLSAGRVTAKGVGASAPGGASSEFKLKADYVDVPILGRFTFARAPRYVFAGRR
jgi:hypothetical protein